MRRIAAWMWLTASLLPGGRAVADMRGTLLDAQDQFNQGNYEQSLKLYKQADEAEAGHPAVQYNIALCHLHLDDADKAVQQLETVATQADVSRTLRRDAFYNIGFIRAASARGRLEALHAPASQPAEQVAPDSPANIEKLQAIADELLRAIGAFRKSREIEPGDQVEHNIRAARITRRNVLGLLARAMEQKEKQDVLDDPQAYLEALIFEQHRQVSLTRWLVLNPPEDAATARRARRDALRLQRQIMERTGTFADHLAQFKEAAERAGQAPPPSSQPGEKTPREQVYHAVAAQMEKVTGSQRDACAFLIDGETKPACERQMAALDDMYVASYMFPLDPPRTLVKARMQQASLNELVNGIEAESHWLRDPLMADAEPPAAEPLDRTPIFYHQMQLGNLLAVFRMQCEHIAASAQTAEDAAPAPQQEDPLLDPELNGKLAEALTGVDELRTKCLEGIEARDKAATSAAQEQMLAMIDAALELLPKTIEQRIMELIVRQSRLNSDVKGHVGEDDTEGPQIGASPMDKVRQWAARLKNTLFGEKPSQVATDIRGQQKDIQAQTVAVHDEIRQQIPSGALGQTAPLASQPAVSPGDADGQPAQVQAYIEAGKHLASADEAMGSAVGGLDQAIVEDSLKPMRAGGPVQQAQGKALEELARALAALRPPTTQPQQDDQDQQQQQQQQQQEDQDTERQIEQLDNERERATRELYQKGPRKVIKDW